MGILEQKSKRLAECLKNLYEKKMYSIEYVILELDRLNDKGKITASDYEEYYNYFCSEMDKQNVVEENTVAENVNNEILDAETNNNDIQNEDETVGEVIEENKEEITVE